jgi:hypothetical protein
MTNPSGPSSFETAIAMKNSESVGQDNVSSSANVGGSNGGGKISVGGGTIGLLGTENGGMSVPGQGPGMDGFFDKINSSAAFTGDLTEVGDKIAAHQIGDELKLSDSGLGNTGPGLSNAARLNNIKFNAPGMFNPESEGRS